MAELQERSLLFVRWELPHLPSKWKYPIIYFSSTLLKVKKYFILVLVEFIVLYFGGVCLVLKIRFWLWALSHRTLVFSIQDSLSNEYCLQQRVAPCDFICRGISAPPLPPMNLVYNHTSMLQSCRPSQVSVPAHHFLKKKWKQYHFKESIGI